jgi:hypothetical protein
VALTRRADSRTSSRGAERKVKSTARKANKRTKRATANPGFELAARWGYVVRGLLYGFMGVIGLLLAVGIVGHAADQKTSLQYIAAGPFGFLVLGIFAVGLAAYSIWGFVRAVYDPLRRGDDVPGAVARLGFAWSGLAYGSLLVAVLRFLAGVSERLDQDSVQSTILAILTLPLGQPVTAAAGVIGIAAGLAQFVDAVRITFKGDLKRGAMTRVEYQAAMTLGRMGMVSRGIVFTITGWFVLQAALHRDAGQAHGFGPAIEAVLKAPSGRILVTLLALGFVALAFHSFAYARWVRMMGTK